jgi:hypothetical protein
LHVYISRGKLIKTPDKKIDPSNPINDLFLQQNSEQKKHTTVIGFDTKKKVVSKNDDNNDEPKINSLVELDKEKKRLEIEKLQRDIGLKDELLKKARNEVIPLEQTLSITRAYAASLKKNFTQSVQLLIQEICSRYEVPPDKAGSYTMKIIDIVNQSSKESVQLLKELESEE